MVSFIVSALLKGWTVLFYNKTIATTTIISFYDQNSGIGCVLNARGNSKYSSSPLHHATLDHSFVYIALFSDISRFFRCLPEKKEIKRIKPFSFLTLTGVVIFLCATEVMVPFSPQLV